MLRPQTPTTLDTPQFQKKKSFQKCSERDQESFRLHQDKRGGFEKEKKMVTNYSKGFLLVVTARVLQFDTEDDPPSDATAWYFRLSLRFVVFTGTKKTQSNDHLEADKKSSRLS